MQQACAPFVTNPALRAQLVDVQRRSEQTIDTVSADTVLEAAYTPEAHDRASALAASFEQFIRDHKDEITALQVLYSRPYARRLRFADVKALAQAIGAPPRSWTPEALWRADETLDRSKVRDALRQDDELVPFPEQVEARFERWLAQQASLGRHFTDEQRRWLELIRHHVAGSAEINAESFDLSPLVQHGGLGKAYQVFGDQLGPLLDELNEALAA
jgi:type I restriction enzyme R subunit